MKEFSAKVLDSDRYRLGESPFYDKALKRYSWVDIIANRHYVMKDGVKSFTDLGQPVGAAVPVKGSEAFVLAAMDGLYLEDKGCVKKIRDLTGTFKPYIRCNDAKADPMGRLFFGSSVADDHPAEGALYSYDHGTIRCLQENTKIANGMAWSADKKTFYFADSLEHGVLCYDYDVQTGLITNRRKLFLVENGVPDGMCIDCDDNLWLAVWGGSRVEKRDGRTGELLGVVHVPAKHTTSCCFTEGNTLFITSSGEDLTGEFDGCLFTCEVDATGPEPDGVDLSD